MFNTHKIITNNEHLVCSFKKYISIKTNDILSFKKEMHIGTQVNGPSRANTK